jgi:hypothetical protein
MQISRIKSLMQTNTNKIESYLSLIVLGTALVENRNRMLLYPLAVFITVVKFCIHSLTPDTLQ